MDKLPVVSVWKSDVTVREQAASSLPAQSPAKRKLPATALQLQRSRKRYAAAALWLKDGRKLEAADCSFY